MSSMLSMASCFSILEMTGTLPPNSLIRSLTSTDLVRRAHKGHGHPVRVELLHPETQVLDILGREAP